MRLMDTFKRNSLRVARETNITVTFKEPETPARILRGNDIEAQRNQRKSRIAEIGC